MKSEKGFTWEDMINELIGEDEKSQRRRKTNRSGFDDR